MGTMAQVKGFTENHVSRDQRGGAGYREQPAPRSKAAVNCLVDTGNARGRIQFPELSTRCSPLGSPLRLQAGSGGAAQQAPCGPGLSMLGRAHSGSSPGPVCALLGKSTQSN